MINKLYGIGCDDCQYCDEYGCWQHGFGHLCKRYTKNGFIALFVKDLYRHTHDPWKPIKRRKRIFK